MLVVVRSAEHLRPVAAARFYKEGRLAFCFDDGNMMEVNCDQAADYNKAKRRSTDGLPSAGEADSVACCFATPCADGDARSVRRADDARAVGLARADGDPRANARPEWIESDEVARPRCSRCSSRRRRWSPRFRR